MGRAVPMKSGLPAFLFHHESGSKELIGNLESEITQVPRSSREHLRRPSRYNSARELTKSETDKRDNKHLLIESPAKAISGGKFQSQHEVIHRCLHIICRHQEVISGKNFEPNTSRRDTSSPCPGTSWRGALWWEVFSCALTLSRGYRCP